MWIFDGISLKRRLITLIYQTLLCGNPTKRMKQFGSFHHVILIDVYVVLSNF